MSDDEQIEADRRLEEALAATGARDPRTFYRERLREIKQADREAYDAAVTYYRDTLIPAVAGGADPVPAWTSYGRRLAELQAPGETVMVDGSGASEPWADPAPRDHLILHLPEARGAARALVVGLPPELTRAQRATYDLLVSGRLTLRE